jgi:PAS domain S-box-containing protein
MKDFSEAIKAQAPVSPVRRNGAPKENLGQVEDSYKLLIEAVQEYAIFLLDPDGIVVSWNAGAERIKGYTAKQIIGKHMSTFYLFDDAEAGKPEKLLERARLEGHVEDEGWRVRKDGSRFWADVVITALFDEDGQLRGYGKVTRDLTERRSTQKLRKAYEELENLVRDMNGLNGEMREVNARLVGREYRVRELENEVRLLRMRLEMSLN